MIHIGVGVVTSDDKVGLVKGLFNKTFGQRCGGVWL